MKKQTMGVKELSNTPKTQQGLKFSGGVTFMA